MIKFPQPVSNAYSQQGGQWGAGGGNDMSSWFGGGQQQPAQQKNQYQFGADGSGVGYGDTANYGSQQRQDQLRGSAMDGTSYGTGMYAQGGQMTGSDQQVWQNGQWQAPEQLQNSGNVVNDYLQYRKLGLSTEGNDPSKFYDAGPHSYSDAGYQNYLSGMNAFQKQRGY